MNKWIAEFDLEDGDTMPEHMDLNYMGVKIDFHCRPMWIPVSERLPEFDVPVLVYQTYYKGNAITIGRYHSDEEQGGYKYWQWIMYDSWFSYGIEHFGIICPNSDFVEAWMPLPKPYEPQESEEEQCGK